MLPSHLRTKQWKQEMRLLSSSPLLQTLDDTAIVATVVGETTTSEAGPKNYAKSGQPHSEPPDLN
jgi:hypothetical protein